MGKREERKQGAKRKARAEGPAFLKRLPAALLVSMLLWLALRPALDLGVAKMAQVLVRAFEYPRVTRLEVKEHRAQVIRSDFVSRSAIPAIPLTEVHFNTIVLLALFLALPGRFSRRWWEWLWMAVVSLFLLQSLNLFFHVKTLYALGLGEWSKVHYGPFSRNFYAYMQYFTDLPGRFSFPFLLWVAFAWQEVQLLLLPGLSASSRK